MRRRHYCGALSAELDGRQVSRCGWAHCGVRLHHPRARAPFRMDGANLSETVPLEHRVLDLRREPMQKNLRLRHRAASAARRFLDEQGFVDIETPFLYKSTPEGAREFLVP